MTTCCAEDQPSSPALRHRRPPRSQVGRAYQAAHEALAQAWGVPAVDMGAGGSIPFVTAYAERFPAAEILVTGVEDPETHAHGPDESLHLAVLERATLAEAFLLGGLS